MSIRLFRDFVRDLTDLADKNLGEAEILRQAQPLMAELLRRDVWLPDMFAQPDTDYPELTGRWDPVG